jgi:hypothetical protein
MPDETECCAVVEGAQAGGGKIKKAATRFRAAAWFWLGGLLGLAAVLGAGLCFGFAACGAVCALFTGVGVDGEGGDGGCGNEGEDGFHGIGCVLYFEVPAFEVAGMQRRRVHAGFAMEWRLNWR